MTTKLYTIPRVKLAKVGDYPVGRGSGRFTETDILSMAEWHSRTTAARLKIDHVDEGPGALPIWGQTANLVAEIDPDDGLLTLFGDYVNVPEPLAAELPTRLPGRSVESRRNVKIGDSVAPMILEHVALLGDKHPAMHNLGDHPTVEGLHETITLDSDADLAVHASRLMAELDGEHIAASLFGRDADTPVDSSRMSDEQQIQEPGAGGDAAGTKNEEQAGAQAPEAPTEAAKGGEGAPTPTAANPADADAVMIPRAELEALRKQREEDAKRIAALEKAEGERVAASRSDYLDQAIADKRIAESARESWEKLMQADEAATRATIDSLPAFHGAPVHAERGHAGTPDALSDDQLDEAYTATFARFDRTIQED